MPPIAKHPTIYQWISICCGFLILITTLYAADGNFHINSAISYKLDKTYYIDANITYQFNDETLEALANGVALSIKVSTEIILQHPWWWNERIERKHFNYQIQYYALSEQYIIRNLQTKKESSYPDQKSAFNALGHIQKLPIIPAIRLQRDGKYLIKLHAALDIEALPYLLRPLAYISPDWQLESEWYSWHLK